MSHRKHSIRSIGILGIAVLSTAAMAQQPTLLGPSQTSCSSWKHERQRELTVERVGFCLKASRSRISAACQEALKDFDPHTAARSWVDAAWVFGYVSGLNAISVDRLKSPDFLKGTNPDATLAWIDNYCSSHPRDSLEIATDALLLELSTKSR